jgi:chemotaxis protein methyltransferase CheR
VHLVFCRNVLIYFNRELQSHVQKLFFDSLVHGGILCLGTRESLGVGDFADKYSAIDKKQRIFKKKY